MLKKLMNWSESITHKKVLEICERNNAVAYPKVRLADIFSIEGSGISNELYSFALMAHFDVIVTDLQGYPLFAVEFDGPTHTDPKQIERDMKKDTLCKRFDLPILRITSEFLDGKHTNMNLLGWFIEYWFVYKDFEKGKQKGELAYDEPFMIESVISIPGTKQPFPLWLSGPIRNKINKLYKQNLIEDDAPSSLLWEDRGNSEYHCLAWIVIDDNRAVYTTGKMKVQNFIPYMEDALDEVTVVQLYLILTEVLNGGGSPVSVAEINKTISNMKAKYGNVISGGGPGNSKIDFWKSKA
ncbi:DUF2726 domain-containing protein [Bacillus cereus]|uniref:DUF2726 domain-containing protein n=1 Tax=Bacillus cereus TaxID=1396 RepID=UPI000BFCF8B7|nr:DUF2726 domain-containing protein [Bacillus cereus]PGQ74933.1 hypothetical protein COA27_04765 [Bacillus cereus]HDR4881555.1 DUF2726 domain-containing protein [Bacillus cereus]